MRLGYAAAPPRGFVEFCARQPGDCNVSAPELAQMRIAANTASSAAAVSAIGYDWSSAFRTREPAARSPAPPPVTATAAAPFDWSSVFTRAQAQDDIVRTSLERGPTGQEGPGKGHAAVVPTMNRETWSLLTRVNDSVNRAIAPRDDIETYGVSDYWATPLESGVRYGDCEDYVLEKRHQLMAAGLPTDALSIAVVLTDKDETHAVLVVATSTGDYVLDNRTPWILPWAQTAYRWRERQVAGSASQWAFADTPPGPRASFLIASTR